MNLYGLQKTTLLDFPGHVACTVFTGGCNFRCPFCQNRELVLPDGTADQTRAEEPNSDPTMKAESTAAQEPAAKPFLLPKTTKKNTAPLISQENFFRFLEKRKGILEGVCITGGEPTLASDLAEFIDRIHRMGYLVKLDTNGYLPPILQNLFSDHKPDYIAMDIKAAPFRYAQASGVNAPDLERIQESVRLIQTCGIPYEFRTTVARELHPMEDFQNLGEWLAGSDAYYLQSYRDCETLSGLHFTPYTAEELETAAAILRKYIPNTFLRGL